MEAIRGGAEVTTPFERHLCSVLWPCTNWGVPIIALIILERNGNKFQSYDLFRPALDNLTQELVDFASRTSSQTFLFGRDNFWEFPERQHFKRIQAILETTDFVGKFGKVDLNGFKEMLQ